MQKRRSFVQRLRIPPERLNRDVAHVPAKERVETTRFSLPTDAATIGPVASVPLQYLPSMRRLTCASEFVRKRDGIRRPPPGERPQAVATRSVEAVGVIGGETKCCSVRTSSLQSLTYHDTLLLVCCHAYMQAFERMEWTWRANIRVRVHGVVAAFLCSATLISGGHAAAAPVAPTNSHVAQARDPEDASHIEQARDGERAPEYERPRIVADAPSGPSRYRLTWTPSWELGGYLGAGVFKLDSSEQARALGRSTALTFGLAVTVLHYAFIELNTHLLIFDDDPVSFGETACAVDDPKNCESWSSSTSGASFGAKAGPQYGWMFPFDRSALSIAFRLGFGGSAFTVSRAVGYVALECTNCRSEHIISGGGLYISPGADVSYVYGRDETTGWAFGVRTSYDTYLTGNINRAFWIGLWVACLNR